VTEQVYRPLSQSVERMGASRLGQFRYLRQRRLAPTAHARRWTPMADWLQASGSPMYYTAAGTNQGTRVYRVQVRP
jgi:hypothetical protein